jgi:hypothetical protein
MKPGFHREWSFGKYNSSLAKLHSTNLPGIEPLKYGYKYFATGKDSQHFMRIPEQHEEPTPGETHANNQHQLDNHMREPSWK